MKKMSPVINGLKTVAINTFIFHDVVVSIMILTPKIVCKTYH